MKSISPLFAWRVTFWGFLSTWPFFFTLSIQKKNLPSYSRPKRKQKRFNAVYIYRHPPLSLTYHFAQFSLCHKTLFHLKSVCEVEVALCGQLIFSTSFATWLGYSDESLASKTESGKFTCDDLCGKSESYWTRLIWWYLAHTNSGNIAPGWLWIILSVPWTWLIVWSPQVVDRQNSVGMLWCLCYQEQRLRFSVAPILGKNTILFRLRGIHQKYLSWFSLSFWSLLLRERRQTAMLDMQKSLGLFFYFERCLLECFFFGGGVACTL